MGFYDIEIELDIFSGPFEKLVELISEKKLPVKKLPVSKIADIFISYVQNNKENLSDIGEFMRLAFYLSYLKSRELLPRSESDQELKRHRNTLYKIIEDYNLIKSATQLIKDDFGTPNVRSVAVRNSNIVLSGDVTQQIDRFFKDFLLLQEKLQIVKELYTVEMAVAMLKDYESFSIKDLFKLSENQKLKFVVFFLAVLNMLKDGAIEYGDGEFIRIYDKETVSI
ncbi:MAG TPA: hypothetical protein PKH64_10920 [Petrotogaceae bacterium]|jgi:segregation and condensation protein A|nr:hypothetical protein [Petrotogaceae bacterium]HPX15453.1 hypothetical protein [Petrotogaceae bacterium]HQC40458.1 hypothetical protein [Petrotogaceae bacterium]